MIDALKKVNLGAIEDLKPKYVSASLTGDEESKYIELLKEFKDVFAWSYKEMSGLDPKHSQCHFRPEPVPLIETEVNKLIEAGFVREVKYPTWISSIVPERSVRALLAQGSNEGKENALYYLSRMMTPNELKYLPTEKLCLALVFSIMKLKHYFQSHIMRLVSRANPVKFFMSKPIPSDRLARWYLQFQQFEIVHVSQKVVKGKALENFLADHPIPDNWELSDEMLDEDTTVIKI
ncbi:uncharacterized protein LOC142175936 [Nicotiana tabacum]|uniref:Uncharacterized protein LOC142175936 n=1 Tax=Nicotiana tabacum TaxID=4097 RepID=A0AC58TP94_TOBAC